MRMLLHRYLVERVDDCYLNRAVACADFAGEPLQGLQRSTGEEKVRALTGEGLGDSAAEPTGGAVDDAVLVLEQVCHTSLNARPSKTDRLSGDSPVDQLEVVFPARRVLAGLPAAIDAIRSDLSREALREVQW